MGPLGKSAGRGGRDGAPAGCCAQAPHARHARMAWSHLPALEGWHRQVHRVDRRSPRSSRRGPRHGGRVALARWPPSMRALYLHHDAPRGRRRRLRRPQPHGHARAQDGGGTPRFLPDRGRLLCAPHVLPCPAHPGPGCGAQSHALPRLRGGGRGPRPGRCEQGARGARRDYECDVGKCGDGRHPQHRQQRLQTCSEPGRALWPQLRPWCARSLSH
mmetsp:Transcript_4828/g.14226  ORF Transcript_4828/g.14226 Transcript_4828/m.14226 type:complete len:216 (+) Transcript_4828:506-1153(+)